MSSTNAICVNKISIIEYIYVVVEYHIIFPTCKHKQLKSGQNITRYEIFLYSVLLELEARKREPVHIK